MQAAIPDSMIWIVAPEMNLGEKEFRVAWDILVRGGKLPVAAKSRRERWIELENGSRIEVRTEENPDQLIGEGVDLMVIAEAARLKEYTWEELLRPTLMDKPGRAIFTSTPRGRNFFWKLYMLGQNPEKQDKHEWMSWQLPSSVNPINLKSDLDEIDARIKEDPIANAHLRQEYHADFVSYRGIVFGEFSRAVHVRREHYEQGQKTMLWIDPGYTNPYSVLLVQITPDETIRVIGEVYLTQRTTDEVIRECEARWPYAMYDSGMVGNGPNKELVVIVDEAGAEPIASWQIAGYNAYGVKPPLKSGIEVYHRMLRDPFRHSEATEENPLGIWPRITFDPTCENTIEEHNLYHYPDDENKRSEGASSEVPVDNFNHSISAIRYGIFSLWPHLFNEVNERLVTEHMLSDEELFSVSEYQKRMSIEDSSAPSLEWDQKWSLGDY